jgi:hypothetical protein
VKYRKGYKYQLAEDEYFITPFRPPEYIITSRITLDPSGTLCVREGYSYDGPSGPVIDRSTNMRGACAHDALYQLMRMELLPHAFWRKADRVYADCLREDGTWDITAKIALAGLKLAGGRAALPKNRKKVYEAP